MIERVPISRGVFYRGKGVRVNGVAAIGGAPRTPVSRIVTLAVLPVVVVVVSVLIIGASGYLPVQLNFPGDATSVTSALLQLGAAGACAFCLGWWVLVLFIAPRRGHGRMVLGAHGELVPAFWAAMVWGGASAALVVVDSADASGQSLSFLQRTGALGYLIQANYLPRAWIVVAVSAFAIAALTLSAVSWDFVPLIGILGLVGVLAPVVVTQVLIGPNHDYGGDAAIIGTPTFTVLAGVLLVLACAGPRLVSDPLGKLRLRRLVLVGGVITVVTDLVVGWFELAGNAPWSDPTGRWFIVRGALIVAAVALTWRAQAPGVGEPSHRMATMMSGVFVVLALAATVVRQRIPSPQYFAPTSIAQNFFGFDLSATPTFARMFCDWRVNILFTTISMVAVALYLLGVVRLRRRGDAWPVGRTIAWVAGWATVVLTTSSGVGRYAGAVFSLHMGLHMSLNMLGPLLMVLRGPTTLALRATPGHGPKEAAGPHEWVTALLQSRFLIWVYNPLEVFAVFILSYYVLYFSPLFQDSIRFHWAHQLAYLHFILAGYLFYGLAIGVDPPPRPVPYLGKLGMILAAMPFHAFFGVIVMTRDTVIGKTFYNYLNQPWMTNLAHDQYVGGGIAWAAGEFPLIVVILALVTQWSRQDARAARRVDRHLDAGIDSSFNAYNEMLARMGSPPKGHLHDDDR